MNLKIKIYPGNGEYFSSEGYNNKIAISDPDGNIYVEAKISLLNYSLNYATLKSSGCVRDMASLEDPGIVIRGTLKNEYDKDYWIILVATAYDSNGNIIGRSLDSGPICGAITRQVESNMTENFELHLKYDNKISRISISGDLRDSATLIG